MVRDADHQPQSAEDVARSLPAETWETISWREGSADVLSSRFARVRVRAAHRDYNQSAPRDEEWLVLEWPPDEEKPSKFWLATVREDVTFDRLVALAKLRWRIERDYQELKQELGLGHFEGRGWRGFHHHATLCIAAYAFLVAERAMIPPSEPTRLGTPPSVPAGSPGRSSSRPTGAARREFDRHHASPPDRRLGSKTRAMSLLHRSDAPSATFVTQ
jgi:SRSO17 transposase